MKKLTAILIGAGGRGIGYAKQMKSSELFDIVAVAEPVDSRRNFVRELYNIPEDRCFLDWKEVLSLGKIADVAVIATMDRLHFAPAMAAVQLGYELLLEKPIAPTPEECTALYQAAEEKGVRIVICTVLRYTPVFIALKNLIDSGKIGKVMCINHEENVGNIHQSHSFVRGNWGNVARSSTMLLQKSCHDIDILQWLIGKPCKEVQSFGMRTFFREENAPEGAPERCTDGCPHAQSCPYSTIKLYLESDSEWFRGACTGLVDPTNEQVLEALKTTNYGKCVFRCDNDVVDHQVVNLHFEEDILVSFTMSAFNRGGRYIHVMGTKGELRAALDGSSPIEFINIFPGDGRPEKETIDITAENTITSGHGGGDAGIIHALHAYLCGEYTEKSIPTIAESYYNHMITFAAEESRIENRIVDVDAYIVSLKKQ